MNSSPKPWAPGFALITLAVITASTWAFIEHKTAWIAQPGIGLSTSSPGRAYLVLIFLRTTAGWRGRKAALMTVIVLPDAPPPPWSGFHARLGALLAGQ